MDETIEEPGTEGLRMDRLVRILNCPRKAPDLSGASVFLLWSNREPVSFDESSADMTTLFHHTVRRFGLTLLIGKAITIPEFVDFLSQREYNNEAERLIQRFLAAYGRNGLNLDSIRGDIKYAG